MRASKKKKLGAQGWKVGSVQDFLDLSPEETAYVEIKLSLARQLKKRRQRKKLTQLELATLIASSQSRVAKMEAGDPSVSLDLLIRSLIALGASNREVARAIERSKMREVT